MRKSESQVDAAHPASDGVAADDGCFADGMQNGLRVLRIADDDAHIDRDKLVEPGTDAHSVRNDDVAVLAAQTCTSCVDPCHHCSNGVS